ncbi:MAG: glycoside hydrolase family 127 protein, partial [Lacrimispora sp.]
MKKTANSAVPLNKIKIQDAFWNKYIGLVKEVILPYQWEVLNDRRKDVETSHCIENFKIAAGEKEGSFKGAVFQDTDVAKWLEAVGFVLSMGRDEALEKQADETIALIGRAQQKDGYLNTYFTIEEPGRRFTNLMEGHELYTAGHMIEAAVAYYEATGKEAFLNIVSKFADLICDTFGEEEGQIHGYPGHQEIELALIKLYRITGNRRYLETAKYFIDVRGVGDNYFLKEEKKEGFKRIFPEFNNYDTRYSQSHIPVRDQKTAEGHAVRANYMYCAMADLAYEYGDESLLDACETLWDDMVHRRMYVTGSVGSSGILERFTTDYDLPNDSNYSETCASIGLALFGKRMADIKKDAGYMDAVELALYNTVLSGIAMDGKSFFYVNPLEVWPDNCMDRTSKEHVKPIRQKWFGVACCPPNIARTLASLGQYLYFLDEDTWYVNLYVSSEAEAALKGVPFIMKIESQSPWKGEVRLTLSGRESVEASMAFRMPDYGENFHITRNGVPVENPCVENGYAKIKGVFKEEVIEITFDMKPLFIHANPKVRVDSGKAAM